MQSSQTSSEVSQQMHMEWISTWKMLMGSMYGLRISMSRLRVGLFWHRCWCPVT